MGIFVMAVAVLVFIAWADRRTMEIPDGCHLVLIGLGLLQMLCGSGLPFGARILGLFIVALPMAIPSFLMFKRSIVRWGMKCIDSRD